MVTYEIHIHVCVSTLSVKHDYILLRVYVSMKHDYISLYMYLCVVFMRKTRKNYLINME